MVQRHDGTAAQWHRSSAVSFLAGVIFIAVSCTPGSCFEETNAYVKAFFYKSGTGPETDKILPPDSITLYGLNMSSKKIYNKAAKQQPALIPLNSSTLQCSFILKINGIADTITFTYSSYPHLLSKECGYTFYHAIDTPVFSKNIIKEIKIRKNTITTLNEENVRIYY